VTPPPRPPHGGPPRSGASSGGGGKGWLWALLIVGLAGVFGVVAVLILLALSGSSGFKGLPAAGSGHRSHLHEVVLKDGDSRDKIAVIELSGVISGEPVDYDGTTLVAHIEDQLEQAADDDRVKAVLLKVDSPGGEVLASDEIYPSPAASA